MLDGHFVIDATTHPCNLGDDNRTDLHGEWSRSRGVYKQHTVLSPDDEHRLTEQEMFTDFDFEAFCEALSVESPVDFAFLHSLPRIFFNKRTSSRRSARPRCAINIPIGSCCMPTSTHSTPTARSNVWTITSTSSARRA